MSSYNYFATLYDDLTENVDYKVRSDYISGFFNEYNIKDGTIVDLACGTGSISIPLAKKGYNVIGVDLSEQMLIVAQNKAIEQNCDISFVNSPMQEYEQSNVADGCVCCLDSINHLTEINDIKKTFKCVYETLKNNGLFVFDVNTIYKHQNILSDNTFVFEDDDYYLVWDNENVDDREVRILIDIFAYNGENYDRYSEEFNEKAYSIKELSEILKDEGFSILGIYDDLSKNQPKDNSERLYFVCGKE